MERTHRTDTASLTQLFWPAFMLNAVWEPIHAVLFYEGFQTVVFWPFFGRMAYATTIDALLITGIAALGLLADRTWFSTYTPKNMVVTAVAALVIAAVIEAKALWLGQWAYTAAMPVFLGLGVSPLIQLPITAVISMALTAARLSPGRTPREQSI